MARSCGPFQWRNRLQSDGFPWRPCQSSRLQPHCTLPSAGVHGDSHPCIGPGSCRVWISFFLGLHQTHRLLVFSFLSSSDEVTFCFSLFNFHSSVSIILLLLLLLFFFILVRFCPFFGSFAVTALTLQEGAEEDVYVEFTFYSEVLFLDL